MRLFATTVRCDSQEQTAKEGTRQVAREVAFAGDPGKSCCRNLQAEDTANKVTLRQERVQLVILRRLRSRWRGDRR